ncbi:MAG: tetratricopeptide repeat protein [Candidatus Lernaella stagnicola]|nr:tetratricopeptide repeat protein [Candidatus Lernaella stagnicola]
MRNRVLFAVVIVLVSAAVYVPSLSGEFVWDDRALITGDEQIQSLSNLPAAFARDFFAAGADDFKYGYYRPVITVSYMFDWALWGENPLGYRLTNLFWHLLATLLLFLLILRLLPTSIWPAAAGAVLFGLHPIHTESVAWISGRTDVVCTALALGSLLCWAIYLNRNEAWVRFDQKPKKKKEKPPQHRQGLGWAAAAAALFLASLLAKEMGVLVLPAAWGMAYLLTAERRSARWKRLLPEALVLAVVPVVYVLMRVGLAGVSVAPAGEQHSLWKALMTFPSAFAVYLGKLFFSTEYNAYYVWPYVSHPFSVPGLIGLLLLAVGVAGVVYAWRSWPVIAFTVGMLLVSFVPLANLVRISAPSDMGFPIAERFLYMPSAFFALLLAVVLQDSLRKKSVTAVTAVAFAVLGLGYASFAYGAAGLWKSEIAVFENTLERHEEAPLLWTALGAAYRRDGRIDKAVAALRKAETLNERLQSADWVAIYNNLGTALASDDQLEEALAQFDKAAVLGKQVDRVQFNRGEALRLLGRSREALDAYDAAIAANLHYLQPRLRRAGLLITLGRGAEAVADLQHVLSQQPGHPDAAALLQKAQQAAPVTPTVGDERLRQANEFYRQGKHAEAEVLLRAVLTDQPGEAEAMVGLAHIEARRSKRGEAVSLLRRAVAARPDHAKAWLTLGALLGQVRDYVGSLDAYRHAAALLPDDPEAQVGLASSLFRAGDKQQAKHLLDEALKRFPQHPTVLLGLVSFHYESGEKDKARDMLELAAAVAPSHPQVQQFRKALASKP